MVLSPQHGYGAGQLMSRHHDTAFIGCGSAESDELVELLLEDLTGTPDLRLADLCRALGLPVAAVGATGRLLSEERLQLAGAERHHGRRRGGRWAGLRRLVG